MGCELWKKKVVLHAKTQSLVSGNKFLLWSLKMYDCGKCVALIVCALEPSSEFCVEFNEQLEEKFKSTNKQSAQIFDDICPMCRDNESYYCSKCGLNY